MSDIHAKLLAAFQAEHKQYLEEIRALLGKMEQAGTGSRADLDEVFRLAHSLKAAGRVCDLTTVETIGQRLETVFAQLRKGTLPPGKGVFDAVRTALNAVESCASALAAHQPLPEPGPALAAMESLLGGAAQSKSRQAKKSDLPPKLLAAFQVEHKEHLEGIRSILASIDKGKTLSGPHVDEAFRRAHSLKGAARITELKAAEVLAHRLENLFARVREGGLELTPEVIRVIHLGLDTIEDCAAALGEQQPSPETDRVLNAIDRVLGVGRPVTATPAEALPPVEPAAGTPPQFPPVETVRVSATNLDGLLRSTGTLLTENVQQNLVAQELIVLGRQIAGLEKEWEFVRNTAGPALRQLAATPALAPVARYLDVVAHQVRTLSRKARAARLLQQRSSWSLGLLGRQLQQDVRRVRMTSAESIFQGFRKMVRDLARDEGKEIDFRVSGLEIEADRLVLQAIKDPLMHILCNAVTHGIESPEERRQLGKDETGQVTLQAEAIGNRLRIAVEDDGRGIDLRRVAEVAVQRRFLSAAEAQAASPDELRKLVVKAGFSTASMVTDRSGRGMGLSVVAEAVTRLQGELDLQLPEKAGTRLVLSLPLSIATQRLLLVACRNERFAVPVHAIEQLLRLKLQAVEVVEGKPMILVQGEPVPLFTLGYLLHREEANVNVADEFLTVMVLRSGSRRVAVAVDAFLAERDSVIKGLDHPAAQVRSLSGGILLEDSSIALVLNPAELLNNVKPGDRPPALRAVAAVPAKRAGTVLVVDDSLTTRTLEKSLLEAHGYNVRIAMDGIEALNQLRAEIPDLVITDIQMPRMDGFTLLQEMKKEPRLAQIPVIVVTSMARREDRERGLTLGANAYIVKRKFDHQDLLDTIRQII